ncbi:VOC family protein [uncultured Microbacterium sp.]|uniref:VOC family protein n=1 Tax=uncultured Microbacterium sp. TaxID=191216 RepID=UPI00262DFA38|nr:VOC family protein [uncultured Microbacterium sp.]
MTAPTSTRLSPTARWIFGSTIIIAALAVLIIGLALSERSTEPTAQPTSEQSSGPVEAGPVITDPAARLPEATAMGEIEIAVQDLPTMTAFYRDILGLEILEQSDESVSLGHDESLIRLTATTGGADDPTSAGLYHSALLYPDAASLAQTLAGIAQLSPQSYQGSADHAVSLAFYIGDPEGNGVELYIDRPEDEWVWENGEVVMGSAFLDPNQFIDENLADDAVGTATMGHVHLRVGDLDEALAFYSGVLGFDVTAASDGALFYSAGGYHHHVATNTWQSSGAGERGETAGLRALTVTVPAASDIDDIASRLTDAGVENDSSGPALVTADPWGNTVRFVVR